MKQELGINIINSIKSILIEKLGLKKHPETIERMNVVKHLYVEDLSKTHRCCMQSRKTEIAIDKQFCTFDATGKVIGLDKNQEKLIISQLGHELLHNASTAIRYSGINNKSNKYRGLNEGITQMITEDIFGYVVSPFADTYKDFKKIAKIIKASIQYKPILRSYFLHTNDLEKEIKSISKDKNFYDELNQELTNLYYMRKLSKYKDNISIFTNIYNEKILNIYNKITIYIIKPTLEKLEPNDRKAYINQILKDISDDKEIEEKIISILKRNIKMPLQEVKEEKIIIKEEEKRLSQKENFVKTLINDPVKALTQVYVEQSGKIYYISKPMIEIKDENLQQKILLALYTYPNPKLDDKIIAEYINRIKNNLPISFPVNNTLEKLIIMSKIKDELKKENLLVINNAKEINNSNYNLIKYINISKGLLYFNDLRLIAERFGVKKENNNDVVFDRLYNTEITDQQIIQYAIIANMWVDSVSKSDNESNNKTLDYAFNKEHKAIYYEIINIMIKNLNVNGKLNIQELEECINSKKDIECVKIIKNLFKTQKSYQTIYKYMRMYNGNIKLLAELERSFEELENPNIQNNEIDNLSEGILKGK